MRVWVYEVLTERCGWSDAEAKARGANVSHFYDNSIRITKAPKDAKNLAIYDETDIPGIMQAAANIKYGEQSRSAYDKPTAFSGTSLEEMGF